MTIEAKLISLAQAVGADVKALKLADGDLTALSTTAKDNLVEALNEVFDLVGEGGGADPTKLPLAGGNMTGAINFAPPVAVTLADSHDIGAVNSNLIRTLNSSPITINSFAATTPGTRRIIFFDSNTGVTLAHFDSFMVLPGGVNIVTKRGDYAEFFNESGILWRCMWYQRGTGQPLVGAPDPTKLPLAGGKLTGAIDFGDAVSIGSITSGVLDWDLVPGNTGFTQLGSTISSMIGASNGAWRLLKFGDGVTLVHSQSVLDLPGEANITPVYGDSALFVNRGGGRWQCFSYQRYSGKPLVGGSDATKLPLAGGTMTGPINFQDYGYVQASDNLDISGSQAVRVDSSSGTVIDINNFAMSANAPSGAERTVFFNTDKARLIPGFLKLPGNLPIVSAPGDIAKFRAEGGADWRCLFYTRRDGKPIIESGGADPTKLPLAGGTLTGALNFAPVVPFTAGMTDENLNWDLVPGNTAYQEYNYAISSMSGASDGSWRVIKFGDGGQLKHVDSVMEVPGGVNITTQAGDTGFFVRRSATRWQCAIYQRGNGRALVATADATKLPLAGGQMTGAINHAGTVGVNFSTNLNIGAADSNSIQVSSSGAVSVSAFAGAPNGVMRLLNFQASNITLVNNTRLALPGAANIVTALGDSALFICSGSDYWTCAFYQKADGTAVVSGGGGLEIDDAAGTGDTDVTWSADKSVTFVTAAVATLEASLMGGAGSAYDTFKELQDLIIADQSGLAALAADIQNRVRFDAAQTLTTPQKVQARANIGAVSQADIDSTIVATVGDVDHDFVADYVAAKA